VAAETALACFLWIGLARMRRAVTPRLGFAWKIAVAAGAAALVGWLLRDLPLLAAAVATLVYVAGALLTRAVPPDVAHAFGLLRRREAE
jgi:hypothetical protein